MSIVVSANGTENNGPFAKGPVRIPGLTYKTEITVTDGLPPKPTTLPRVRLNGTSRKTEPIENGGPPSNGDAPSKPETPDFKSNGGHTLPRSFGNKEIIKTPNGTITRRRRVTSHSPRLRKSINRVPCENIDSDDEVRVAPIGWRNVDIPSERQRSPERNENGDTPPVRPPRPPRARSRSLVETVPRSQTRTPADGREHRDNASGSDGEYAGRGFIRGSDPRVATCRGKLQNKRSRLNQEINKELRLRAGAENLFKATTNRKLRETVALELSYVNSNLQLLKEQLAELNSSVELYQNESTEPYMPMIPLGLKETKEIDFREPFKDFILEHYSEDGNKYENAISEFTDIRQAMRTPLRDKSGVALLFQYYNQLYFVERRFFPPDRSLGIYFEWYDSLTGAPSCQRTVAFEKACVLFNMGALYTQLGARQDRGSARGLDLAVDSFLRSAGTFTYISDNFTNAPSMDLGPHMLQMLVQLMLAQARECLLEKLELQTLGKGERSVNNGNSSSGTGSIAAYFELAQEAAHVADAYNGVHALMAAQPVADYVPFSWAALARLKREHFTTLSHLHCARGIMLAPLERWSDRTKETLRFMQNEPDTRTQLDIREPQDEGERKLLGRAHLRAALLAAEEAQRQQRMCRALRSKQALTGVLKLSQERALDAFSAYDDEDDFRELLDPPHIIASTKFQLSLTAPDFSEYRVQDPFRALGPVAIFSARHHWTAPRQVTLQRAGDDGFGFSVRGDAPVIVAAVDSGSLADFGGMKEGDFIVTIGDKDVKWAAHEDVVKLIKNAGDSLTLKLVTPMDRNYLKSSSNKGSASASSSSGEPSPASSVVGSTTRKLTWNPFRKHRERESAFEAGNVILR